MNLKQIYILILVLCMGVSTVVVAMDDSDDETEFFDTDDTIEEDADKTLENTKGIPPIVNPVVTQNPQISQETVPAHPVTPTPVVPPHAPAAPQNPQVPQVPQSAPIPTNPATLPVPAAHDQGDVEGILGIRNQTAVFGLMAMTIGIGGLRYIYTRSAYVQCKKLTSLERKSQKIHEKLLASGKVDGASALDLVVYPGLEASLQDTLDEALVSYVTAVEQVYHAHRANRSAAIATLKEAQAATEGLKAVQAAVKASKEALYNNPTLVDLAAFQLQKVAKGLQRLMAKKCKKSARQA